eukprot:285021-Chlamydomonas_euryale.AAC.1
MKIRRTTLVGFRKPHQDSTNDSRGIQEATSRFDERHGRALAVAGVGGVVQPLVVFDSRKYGTYCVRKNQPPRTAPVLRRAVHLVVNAGQMAGAAVKSDPHISSRTPAQVVR